MQCNPLLWVVAQKLCDQVAGVRSNVLRNTGRSTQPVLGYTGVHSKNAHRQGTRLGQDDTNGAAEQISKRSHRSYGLLGFLLELEHSKRGLQPKKTRSKSATPLERITRAGELKCTSSRNSPAFMFYIGHNATCPHRDSFSLPDPD